MKVKIKHPQQNPNQEPQQKDFIDFTIEDIQKLEDSICTELYIGNILDYYVNRDELFMLLVKKVRYGGKLIIHGIDLLGVAFDLSADKINIQTASQALYGGKQSATSLEYMRQMLTQFGFNITYSHISSPHYAITAQRPVPHV